MSEEKEVQEQRQSQCMFILNLLKAGNTITTREAAQKGVIDLQSVIRHLRKEYPIQDEWVRERNAFGKLSKYKKYWLEA